MPLAPGLNNHSSFVPAFPLPQSLVDCSTKSSCIKELDVDVFPGSTGVVVAGSSIVAVVLKEFVLVLKWNPTEFQWLLPYFAVPFITTVCPAVTFISSICPAPE